MKVGHREISVKKLPEQIGTNDVQMEEATLADIQLMASSIAHEQKNYLAGIKVIISTMRPVLANLINGYQQALDAKLIETTNNNPRPLPERLNRQIDRLLYGVDNANKVISLQLRAINSHHGHIDNSNFSKCSINTIVSNSLSSYPFDDAEDTLVKWQPSVDYDFNGEALLTQHVLWNLLNNALPAIKQVAQGQVKLWAETGKAYNRLYVEDNGTGIPKTLINEIFAHGVSKRAGGNGVGLAFCKAVMQAYGGDIQCESEPGQYTRFILSFPVLDSSVKNK